MCVVPESLLNPRLFAMDAHCRRCGRWMWSETAAAVNNTIGGSAVNDGSRPQEHRERIFNTSAPHSALATTNNHLPQFSATWTAGPETAVYSFGGSSSTDTSEISNIRRASGEQCATQAIGISDELWRFSSDSGWQRVKKSEEGEKKLWPRARYASTSWSLGDGQGQGLVFSGEFEFCYKRDYLDDSGTPAESTDMFFAPDSLFLFTPAVLGRPAEWSLLGGSDNWKRVALLDFAEALQLGYLDPTYPCGFAGDGFRECAWPLPRARSQGWTLSGQVYMFSGLSTLIDQGFDEARSRSLLLNDLWQISVQRVAGDKPHMTIARVAACGSTIEEPAVLPASSAGVYPGPRFSAATWSVPSSLTEPAKDGDSGWLFGGVGRLVSDRLGAKTVPAGGWPDGPSAECNSDAIQGGFGAVRNLCDLWVFVPGVGFRLVQACNVDVPQLREFATPELVVPQSATPTAAIFATTWVGQLSSLWLFGGLTGCAAFDGIGPDGTTVPQWAQSKTESWGVLLENMTMCDLAMRGPPRTANFSTGSDEWRYPIAAFPAGHIDQPCTADMWRFSLVSETWVHVAPPSTSTANTSRNTGDKSAWPLPRCGAAALPSSGGREGPDHTSSAQLFVGGWSGSSSGECEEWPPTPNSTNGNSTASAKHCQRGTAVSGADDTCPTFRGFLSADVPSRAARAQRRHLAQCRPMTEVWQLGLAEVP